jgi:hypothetical protein
MPKPTTLVAPAILASLLVTVVIDPRPGRAAEEECLARPNATAPEGSHWYYRVNRATHRQCWFLGEAGKEVGKKVRRTAVLKRLPPPKPTVQPTKETPAEVKADGNRLEAAFSMRWPALPRLATSIERAPAPTSLNSYADERQSADTQVPQDDMPVVWPVLNKAVAPKADQAVAVPPGESTGSFRRLWAYIAGAMALSGAIAGTIFTIVDTSRRGRTRIGGGQSVGRVRQLPRPKELRMRPPPLEAYLPPRRQGPGIAAYIPRQV